MVAINALAIESPKIAIKPIKWLLEVVKKTSLSKIYKSVHPKF